MFELLPGGPDYIDALIGLLRSLGTTEDQVAAFVFLWHRLTMRARPCPLCYANGAWGDLELVDRNGITGLQCTICNSQFPVDGAGG